MLAQYKDITNIAKNYLSEQQLLQLDKAFVFAKKAHYGQKRSSGEDYIHHPIAVTRNLAILKASITTLTAGMLHDVVEDCDISLEEITKKFGKEVSKLVDGVTKIDALTNTKNSEIPILNIKKVLLSGVADPRILIIKLCDRLHNISTLDALDAHKRRRIARETLQIYRPLALKLSLFDISMQLEEKAFMWAYPEETRWIENKLKIATKLMDKNLEKITKKVVASLNQKGIKAQILSRRKTMYSIYKKLYVKGVPWTNIYDLLALRVITKHTSQCYEILGILHQMFKHVPFTFKDYITIPKSNGYQSIHTCLTFEGLVFEVQIRTEAMDFQAKTGVASTWTYKSNEKSAMKKYLSQNHSWVIDIENLDSDNQSEFIDDLYTHMASRNIYTFTPHGDVIVLERGATVLDFAYQVHTHLGDHFKYAIINNQKYEYSYVVQNGATIEIVTSSKIQAINDWLKYVKTKSVAASVRRVLGPKLEKLRPKNEKDGKDILSKFFTQKDIDSLDIKKIGNHYKLELKNINNLYEAIGRHIIRIRDFPFLKKLSKFKKQNSSMLKNILVDVANFDGRIYFANCCGPIPGDIISSIRSRNTIKVHLADCIRLKDADKDKIYNGIKWNNATSDSFSLYHIKLKIKFSNQKLMLNNIMCRLTEKKVNIASIREIKLVDDPNKLFVLKIEVKNAIVLNQLISTISAIPGVVSIQRIK